jgi:hypothetical protein
MPFTPTPMTPLLLTPVLGAMASVTHPRLPYLLRPELVPGPPDTRPHPLGSGRAAYSAEHAKVEHHECTETTAHIRHHLSPGRQCRNECAVRAEDPKQGKTKPPHCKRTRRPKSEPDARDGPKADGPERPADPRATACKMARDLSPSNIARRTNTTRSARTGAPEPTRPNTAPSDWGPKAPD